MNGPESTTNTAVDKNVYYIIAVVIYKYYIYYVYIHLCILYIITAIVSYLFGVQK